MKTIWLRVGEKMPGVSLKLVEICTAGNGAKLLVILLPKDSELIGILCHSATGFHSVALFALREVARCGVFFSRQGHRSGRKKTARRFLHGRSTL